MWVPGSDDPVYLRIREAARVTPSFFSRDRIIAPPGWSRWLVPPAALSIHLSIGAAYS